MAIESIINPPADLSAFDYEELDGSPTEQFTPPRFVRKFKLPWSERIGFARAMAGYSERSGDVYTYTPAQTYADYPAAFVTGVRADPFGVIQAGATVKEGSYEYAQVTVEYSVGETQGGGGSTSDAAPFTSESLEPTAEFLTLSGQDLFWTAGNVDPLEEGEEPQQLLVGLDWLYRIHRLTQIPSAVFSMVETPVNDSAVTSQRFGQTFAAETLLYHPPKVTIDTDINGLETMTLEMRFSYRPQGWNKFFRRGYTEPQEVYDIDSIVFKPYTPGDFSALIFPPPAA